jgi:uncharacterized protein YciI
MSDPGPEIPEGIEIESIWAAEATYSPDAAERRGPVRAEHLNRLAALRDAGIVVEAGGFADLSGSLILLRLPTEAEAVAVLKEDVYWRAGVWVDLRVRALGVVRRSGQGTRGG